jgi:hypothetical protein
MGVFSKKMCDLATVIISDKVWDPNNLQAPNQIDFPPPKFMDKNLPFSKGRKLIVNIKIDPRGIQNFYIDDLIGLGLDFPNCDNIKQSKCAPLLAIHALSHPLHKDEPIPLHEMAARHKLKAEGLLKVTKMILGWHWDF